MQWFFDLPLIEQIAITYMVAVNILTFFYFSWDKMRSISNKSRVSEKMLWILAFIGGSAGAISGMYFFRHKTQKISFQAVVALILTAHIILILFFSKF